MRLEHLEGRRKRVRLCPNSKAQTRYGEEMCVSIIACATLSCGDELTASAAVVPARVVRARAWA